MKILFTGMASSHCGPTANMNFFCGLTDVAKQIPEADVTWMAPNLAWTREHLDSYDAIFVGVLPPTSPSANSLYGAMNVINLMFESPKLYLVVDHPQIWQFKSSIAAVTRNVESIYTSFYSKRRDFKIANTDELKSSIFSAAKKLQNLPWPKTIYPQLPWKSNEDVAPFLTGNLVGVNIDSHLLDERPVFPETKINTWHVDSQDVKWSTQHSKLLVNPVLPMKHSAKAIDSDVLNNISISIGSLIAPQERGVGTWWSYRYIQSLNSYTPIISEWRETSKLGASWNVLAASVEEMHPADLLSLAVNQRQSYIQSIPSKEDSINLIKSLVEVAIREVSNA
jgi:hypothetical protein